jgi:hypothetical protein
MDMRWWVQEEDVRSSPSSCEAISRTLEYCTVCQLSVDQDVFGRSLCRIGFETYVQCSTPCGSDFIRCQATSRTPDTARSVNSLCIELYLAAAMFGMLTKTYMQFRRISEPEYIEH